MEIIIFISLILFILYSFYDLKKEQRISKKGKVNWTYIFLLLPIIGSIIYFIYKNFKKKVYLKL